MSCILENNLLNSLSSRWQAVAAGKKALLRQVVYLPYEASPCCIHLTHLRALGTVVCSTYLLKLVIEILLLPRLPLLPNRYI